jgi:hypothetical protein
MTNTQSPIRFLLIAALLTGTIFVSACASSKTTAVTPGTPTGCSPATTPCT